MHLKDDKTKIPFHFPLFNTRGASLWDDQQKNIVIIGSGIGGMASGALFAKLGHRVTVLEMNKKLIGGHGRWLTFRGLKFSMGPQYVWEFNEGELGDRFLDFLDIKKDNPFLLMAEDGFERIFIGNRESSANSYYCSFKVPLGLDRFKDELVRLFPEEKENITRLFDDMTGIYTTYKNFISEELNSESRIYLAAKLFLRKDVPLAIKIKLSKVISQSLAEWFNEYGISSMVRRILYGHGGIFAEAESDMSAMAYIIATGNYHRGARYPKKGFHHFFGSLASIIKKHGGSVHTGKKVVRLITKNSTVTHAVCEDGSQYPCDIVFSDISPRLTDALLDKGPEKYEYTPSHCIPTICIGINKGLKSIHEMKGRNYWWQDGNEVEYHAPDVTAPPRMLFINSPTANGFSASIHNDLDGLVLFCPGNYEQEKAIHDKGPEAVKKFKKKLAKDIVNILDKNIFPGIKEKTAFVEVISSIDIENDTGCEKGSAYGRRMNVKEILKGAVKETGLPRNIYNVSSSRNYPGIAEGISTAALLMEELTGRKL